MIHDEGRDRAADDAGEPRGRHPDTQGDPIKLEHPREVLRLELEMPLLVPRDHPRHLRERRHALGEQPVVDDAYDLRGADDHHLRAEPEQAPPATEEALAPVPRRQRRPERPESCWRSRVPCRPSSRT